MSEVPEKIKKDLKNIVMDIGKKINAFIDRNFTPIEQTKPELIKKLYHNALVVLFYFLIIIETNRDNLSELEKSINNFEKAFKNNDSTFTQNIKEDILNDIINDMCVHEKTGGMLNNSNKITLFTYIANKRNILCNIYFKLNKKNNECDIMHNTCKKIGGNHEINKLREEIAILEKQKMELQEEYNKQLKILKCCIVKTVKIMVDGEIQLNFHGNIIPYIISGGKLTKSKKSKKSKKTYKIISCH